MDIGLIGLPQSGKKTLFELLLGGSASGKIQDPMKSHRGVAEVQDRRFDRLLSIYSPKKHTRARIEFLLLPKIEGRSLSESELFDELIDVDALCHVVRVFRDESVYHVSGSVDPPRDIEFVNSELILHDLLFIEKRLARIEDRLKKMKDETAACEKALLERLRVHLEGERPLRLQSLKREEEKILASYPLLTRKQMVVVLNIGEAQMRDSGRIEELQERYLDLNIRFVDVPAETEREISTLETAEDREAFMRELGMESTALHTLVHACIEALGLISFFTVTGGELRQWFLRRSSTAAEAAGAIHSDMQKGFIRAEVVHFEDLARAGSEDMVKSEGKHYIKGRDYVVEDGDVLHIRFNV